MKYWIVSSNWRTAPLIVGFPFRVTDLAFLCVCVCATCKPQAVLLDEDLFQVDSWSIPELLHLISPETAIVLTVEKNRKLAAPAAFRERGSNTVECGGGHVRELLPMSQSWT